MATTYVFFNPLAGNGKCGDSAKGLTKVVGEGAVFCNMTDESVYESTLFSLAPDDKLIVCGGDGTLNRFINFVGNRDLGHDVFYCPLGSGNDFAHDLGKTADDEPFDITEYLKNLPTVCVKGNTYRFINGIGYGIDGYCCEVGDKMRGEGKKDINYAGIAIKGLLFHYKPTNAVVTVDGVRHEFKKVWLAPTMNGRFYGGGMMPTPEQVRNGGKLSTMLFHGSGKIKTLAIFPSIFKGEHVKHTDCVTVLEGKTITVEFDSPRALQIDGETVLGVTSYTARPRSEQTNPQKKRRQLPQNKQKVYLNIKSYPIGYKTHWICANYTLSGIVLKKRRSGRKKSCAAQSAPVHGAFRCDQSGA